MTDSERGSAHRTREYESRTAVTPPLTQSVRRSSASGSSVASLRFSKLMRSLGRWFQANSTASWKVVTSRSYWPTSFLKVIWEGRGTRREETDRERDRGRDRERDRDGDRERETERETQRKTKRQTHTERKRMRDTERDRKRERGRETATETDTHRETQRECFLLD